MRYLFTQKVLSARLARWLTQLFEYNFEVKHIPGKHNVIADLLSGYTRPEDEKEIFSLEKNINVQDYVEYLEPIIRLYRSIQIPEDLEERKILNTYLRNTL